MTFNEMCNSVNKDLDFIDIFLEKADVFSESSYHEYEHNLAQIEVKVLTEAGTEEDKEELNNAAKSGFVERTKSFVNKLVSSIVEHLANIGTNISSFFNQVKVKVALKDITEAIKDSKVANTLVKIKDATRIEDFFENAKAETLKFISFLKAKGANISESTAKAFQELKEKYEENKRKEEEKCTVEVTIKNAKGKIEDLVGKASKVTTKTASDIKSAVSNIDWSKYPAEVAEKLRAAIAFLTKVARDAAGNIWDGITSCFTAIKSAISGAVNKAKEKIEKKEDKAEGEEAKTEESALDPEISAEINDIFNQLENVNESTEEEYDTSTVEGYLAAMEKELFGEEDGDAVEEKSKVDEYIDGLLAQL